MEKQKILNEIQRISKLSGGKAPGFQKFSNVTGLRKAEWYPNLWLRWGDAIIEAGCKTNDFNTGYDINYLIEQYIELIRELGHFPIEGELRLKRKVDKSFPSHSAFSQLGNKQKRVEKIYSYCKSKTGFEDVIEHCKSVSQNRKRALDHDSKSKIGYVYLIQHGARNEYKIGRTSNPIRREGEIRLELPEKVKPIHYIETDDPAGVENYWHRRFKNKRKEGEWFSLNPNDIRSFKKWKKIN